MRHLNRFACDRTGLGEEWVAQSRWCRRRTGGGWDLEVLNAVEQSRADIVRWSIEERQEKTGRGIDSRAL